jgi:hypothetical protein
VPCSPSAGDAEEGCRPGHSMPALSTFKGDLVGESKGDLVGESEGDAGGVFVSSSPFLPLPLRVRLRLRALRSG